MCYYEQVLDNIAPQLPTYLINSASAFKVRKLRQDSWEFLKVLLKSSLALISAVILGFSKNSTVLIQGGLFEWNAQLLFSSI